VAKILLFNLISFLLFSVNLAYGKVVTKFDWLASESGPEGYVMQVVKGDFIYPDGGSLYVPNGNTLDNGWGDGWSSHVVGPDLKPLPKSLSITFFSYLENKFYQGEFDLPYERIVKLFTDGYYSPKEKKKITYTEITAGITPGGSVSVWVTGIDKTTEVFHGKANEADVDWKKVLNNPEITREEFVKDEIEDTITKEQYSAIKKNGIPFGLWEKYHQQRYQWQPVSSGFEMIDGLVKLIKYYNGEEGYLYVPLDENLAKETRCVPKELHFNWKFSEEKNLVYQLYFDEKEVFELFEKLGKDGKSLIMDLKMVDSDKGKQFGVLLKNDEEGIYFRKVKVKKYRSAH